MKEHTPFTPQKRLKYHTFEIDVDSFKKNPVFLSNLGDKTTTS
tara:strand:- start:819 stop:947 length:129 start_codon:yes stop_codon:yes gene_type:complete